MNLDARAVLLGNAVRAYLAGRGAGSKTPVAFLYNGVRLPKLPEWDKTAYPYAWIVRNDNDGSYYLYGQNANKTAFANGTIVIAPLAGVCYKCTGTQWVEDYTVVAVTGFVIWATHDLYYTDGIEGIGGTLCLAASDPIPVYE